MSNNARDFEEGENGISLDSTIDSTPRTRPESKPKEHTDGIKKDLVEGVKKLPIGKIIGVAAGIIVLGVLIYVATHLDYSAISDQISSIGYEPSQEILKTMSELKLTDEGERILRATRPEYQPADTFNNSCPNSEQGTAILGCYKDNRIFVFDVADDELDGVRQSTLAHELLHAFWARLSTSEKEELQADLDAVASADATVSEHMELYTDTVSRYDELHSTIGTSVKPSAMTDKLRKHYERIFKDISIPSDYYAKYSEIFERDQKRLEEIKKEIDQKKLEAEALIAEYNKKNEQIGAEIADFNRRASDGSFTSLAEFDREREQLVAKNREITNMYQQIRDTYDDINKLVAEYNNNVAHKNKLNEMLNSNIVTPKKLGE